MALANPLPGGTMTQRFGPSVMSIQPTMWVLGTIKAHWQWFTGAVLNYNVHAGVDFAGMVSGSALVAAESGVVTRSEYDGINGGGNVVEVQIRPGVKYSYNHCQQRFVSVGQHVSRGQKIASVGATGTITNPDGTKVRSAYGVHCHTLLLIYENSRWMIYDFLDFMAGGSNANDSRIKPPSTTVDTPNRLVRLNPYCNVRSSPDLDVGDANIRYVTRPDGVYNRSGVKVANLSGWTLTAYVSNDDGKWGILKGLGTTVYMMSGLFA